MITLLRARSFSPRSQPSLECARSVKHSAQRSMGEALLWLVPSHCAARASSSLLARGISTPGGMSQRTAFVIETHTATGGKTIIGYNEFRTVNERRWVGFVASALAYHEQWVLCIALIVLAAIYDVGKKPG